MCFSVTQESETVSGRFFWIPGGHVCFYLVGVERSNTGDLAAPVDTELCEDDDDDDGDEDCDYYVDV